jgi:branched-chain amino acid transport system ATP-binding protein
VLSLKGLSAGYNGSTVVRDLDLEVGEGEVVALLGPNGAGKTTTLRAISGIVRPIHWNRQPRRQRPRPPLTDRTCPTRHRPCARGSGDLLRSHRRRTLPSRLSHGAARSDIAYKYFPALVELADRRVGLLSGGQQQMLALGRALARKPRLLLLDEMSLGLAPIIVEGLLPVVSEYARQSGCSVLLGRTAHPDRARGRRPRLRAVPRRARRTRARRVLRGDHDLILSSYLGEV